ncbi:MAG: tRNA uridine(34) 5-carboxymethylaminomethyl modification radical SAM/GNAT enzyme Elp3, partial [Patescibacteria group bacterium]|nr:tRNA uridine(34) 5-carboxymethylaminomethyl modification radical SAM/GNAT enzyme Elp3 [Patescibacteria group bacterium]
MTKKHYTLIELALQELLKSKANLDLGVFKRKISKKLKIPFPSNFELLRAYHKLVKNKTIKENKNLEFLLRKRKIRSLSGIVNVSVLTKPFPCPGKCIYCPSEKGIPKSYLKKEPAVQRAILNNFDPYLQVQNRLESLEKIGHPIDKIELRIIGGTWSYYPKNYQTRFITNCFSACNNKIDKKKHKIKQKIKPLEKEQKINENAKHRLIGITVETRPDFIDKNEIKQMRKLGITRVELGVQSIYNDVLKLNKRGHSVKAIIRATKLLKDAGFKVSFQMMPNLFGSSFKRDIEMFKELFGNPDFQPDLLKIYPLALLKNTPLYKIYEKKKYKPYSKDKLIKLLIEIKKEIPFYCRVQRVIRDIPAEYITEGGTKISNLRELVQKEMEKQKLKCKCIRCREIKGNYNPKEKIYLFREDYKASDGKEIFLSYESKNRKHIYSLLRLRLPSYCVTPEKKHFMPALQNAAIVREIHTYGQLHPLKNSALLISNSPQHKGMGKKLMKEAERITKEEFGLNKIAVISGIGVRNYYKKLGYKQKNTYMVKPMV